MGKHWAPIGPGLAANLRNFCSDIQIVKLNFMISKLELVEFKLIQETRSLPRKGKLTNGTLQRGWKERRD